MTPAGPAWCSRYPTSRSLDDLAEPFRSGVVAFLADLAARGCTAHIAATRRPEQRAWLMRGAWDISRGGLAAAPAPRDDIDIEWTVSGACAMVATYGLAYRPSLTSRHIDGLAIDMAVANWSGSAEELYQLGAKHGVHKLRSDPPHWSSDGH